MVAAIQDVFLGPGGEVALALLVRLVDGEGEHDEKTHCSKLGKNFGSYMEWEI